MSAISVVVIVSSFRPPLASKVMKQNTPATTSVVNDSRCQAPARGVTGLCPRGRASRQRTPLVTVAGASAPRSGGRSVCAAGTDTVAHGAADDQQQARE